MTRVVLCRPTSHTVLLFVVLVAGLSGCKKKEEDAPDAAVSVQVAHASTGAISEEIAADAILAPLSQAAISSRISAPIAAEYVQRGSRVRRGQLLLKLDDRDLRGSTLDSKGAVTTAEAGLTAATHATIPEEVEKSAADVAQTKTAFDVAHKTTEERRNLFQQGALSGRDLDTAIATEAEARAAYDNAVKHQQSVLSTTRVTDQQTARGQLTSAQGRLQNAEAQVSFATLRSPIDGVVTDRPLFPGETAGAGTALVTVMDTSSLLAKLHLAQSAAQQLVLGHEAEVTVPGVDEPVKATVSFISPSLDAGSTTVEVWLKLPNADGRFKVGTPVHAVISGRTVENALQVPTAAVVPGKEGGTAVMIIGIDGAARSKAVTVGIRTAESAQILSGISASDTVITEGGYGLDDGTKVTVGKPDGDDKGKD